MAQTLLNKAGKALFEKHMEQYAPKDPYYEEYTNEKGKVKRRRREIPPGLSKRDQKILKSVQRRAHYLDKAFAVFDLDGHSSCNLFLSCSSLYLSEHNSGIIPGAGDIVDALLNYLLVLRKAKQAELPGWLVRRMLLNNLVSAGVGVVPFVGDVILAAYKANSRNAALLEEFLRIRGEELINSNPRAKIPSKPLPPPKRRPPRRRRKKAQRKLSRVLPRRTRNK
ncbi:hypothetical protein DL96DRAFT_1575061 [Flagelloscypha sp. PMI_526]|nr:hypothetical protein DL96DRAFT_1575061 [Flagelloscypha sp. PMI_526]